MKDIRKREDDEEKNRNSPQFKPRLPSNFSDPSLSPLRAEVKSEKQQTIDLKAP
jgi:hypothetical protein